MKFIREMIAKKTEHDEGLDADELDSERASDQVLKKVAIDLSPDVNEDVNDMDYNVRPSTDVTAETTAKTGAAGGRRQPDKTIAPSTGSTKKVNIWDIDDDDDIDDMPVVTKAPVVETPVVDDAKDDSAVVIPSPVVPTPAGRRPGRVKTRILGFEHSNGVVDLFDPDAVVENSGPAKFPVGWIVVVDGPGRGESFVLLSGLSQIGRGNDQQIQLNFGDGSISRNNHAAIAYDVENHKFFFGHGGKSNIVRLNDMPVLSTEALKTGDVISIGETKLRFVAFCGEGFNWDEKDSHGGDDDIAIA